MFVKSNTHLGQEMGVVTGRVCMKYIFSARVECPEITFVKYTFNTQGQDICKSMQNAESAEHLSVP